jgi:hypothetical protein
VNGNGKHSSLRYGNNYCRKIFYSTGPWTNTLAYFRPIVDETRKLIATLPVGQGSEEEAAQADPAEVQGGCQRGKIMAVTDQRQFYKNFLRP